MTTAVSWPWLCKLFYLILATSGFTAAFVSRPVVNNRSDPSLTKDKLPPLTAITLDIGVFSEAGADPNRPQKVNQDAFFQATYSDRNMQTCYYTCVGVLDGHGLKGHIVSEFLAQQIPVHFQRHMEDLFQEDLDLSDSNLDDSQNDDNAEVSYQEFEEKLQEFSGLTPDELDYRDKPLLHQAMIKAFHSVHFAAMQNKGVPAGRNGATCVMVVMDHRDNNTIHIAHVGDSRVVRFEQDRATPLSVETTVKIESERERVEKGEGSVRGTNVFYGPVGIAMTRSLGNAVMLRAGVVPTPVLETFPGMQSAAGEHLVLATDGIWDVLRNEALLKIISANKNDGAEVQALCETIAAEARRKWVGDLPIMDEEKVDDITCLVVRAT